MEKQNLSSLIWSTADDVLRGMFKPSEYGRIILPFVVLRRLDCVLEPQKDKVKFQGQFAKYVKKGRNSIIDALTILRERKLISNYYSILVNKRIPVFAGMGGGTSNAFCLIKHLVRKRFDKKVL